MQKVTFKEASFGFSASRISELKKQKVEYKIIGQQRAVLALKRGLEIKATGFNVFVMGESGTGRWTTVNEVLKDFKPDYSALFDIAYVYNFNNPLEPNALFFPGGEGRNFRKSLKKSILEILDKASSMLMSESYLSASSRISNETDALETSLFLKFSALMQEKGFKFLQTKKENGESSFDLNPIWNGKEMTFLELQDAVVEKKLKTSEFDSIKKEYYKCLDLLGNLFDDLIAHNLETNKKLQKLFESYVYPIITEGLTPLFDLVKSFEKKYYSDGKKHTEKLLLFLENIQKNLKEKKRLFDQNFKRSKQRRKFMSKYDINLVCENSPKKNYIITENLPNFANLFGAIDGSSISDVSTIDAHMRISAGAVHKAYGGYLILRLQDLLAEEDCFFYLKRVLQSGQIKIHTSPSSTTKSIFNPVAIPANFKVILIGEANSYDLMYQYDQDFAKLFKICAEFSPIMVRNTENEIAFISFVDQISKKYKTPKIMNSAYSKLLVYACKLAGSRNFISTQFAKISDIILHASQLAKNNGVDFIDGKIITQTLDELRFLSSLPEQEYLDSLKYGIVFLSVSGKKVGCINGLAIQDRGYFAFGVPEVITAQSSPGENGLVNIESEVGFSGEVYDKAHLIISSLLKNTYARNLKLSIDASICFEQSYGMIEGDSASCAEFLVLLSSIAEIPIRQDFAITGSLNQHGDVQPIGGVSEKVIGFFNACKIIGFTGTQGVVIPKANIQDLFLNDEILNAIKNGSFTIYAISKIDDAVKLFMETSHEKILKAVQSRLENFNSVMKKLVQLEKQKTAEGGN